MRVEVVMAWPRRLRRVQLELPAGATVSDAVAAAVFDGIDEVAGYAVFGVAAGAQQSLRDGDRVELLRPLQIDPKEARRRRAQQPKG
ncbi:RnfH family protein [Pseudoxanthomonas kalamensis DSM 18571]|uniref:RnfH family protein n=1 Tax=Pseudoxanthomonas kalamensis TaxID=289483 RepID=UPI0013911E2A|nr:RnfH family protein [Pseudoxanthomonas kalamensis]KAF1709875.1 RnfH family protein [Pseudoxanthomonas kalamensis DSM 18571]